MLPNFAKDLSQGYNMLRQNGMMDKFTQQSAIYLLFV